MIGLLNKLKEDASIDVVFFDESGAWSVIPSNMHPIKVPRDQILSREKEIISEEKAKDIEGNKDEEISNLLSENGLLKEQVELLESEKVLLEKEVSNQTEEIATLSQLHGDKDEKFNAEKAVYEKKLADLEAEVTKLKKK